MRSASASRRTRRSGILRRAGCCALAAAFLTACGETSAPDATPSPSPTPEVAGPSVLAPPAPAGPADNGPAAEALGAAARRTGEAGAFRLRITAAFGTGSQAGSLSGTGETESPSRYHLLLTFTAGPRTITEETVGYDGTTYARNGAGPWRAIGSGTASDPRRYLGYASGALAVRDTGSETHDGARAERFAASVYVASLAATPAAIAGAGPTANAQMVAWVDAASGRLVTEDITSGAGTARAAHLVIDFTDFGASIKVVPPPTASP